MADENTSALSAEARGDELLLIDANSLVHRAFHALPPLTAPDGAPAGALYGIASVLLKLRREGMPRYAAALFDRPEPTFRKKEYDAYKAHRPKAPEPLVAQIIAAHDLFPAFGVRTIEAPGFEADDLIGALAVGFGGRDGVRATILTGDLDTLQLVRDGAIAVRVFRTGLSDTTTYDESAVRARYGLRPDQLADYKTFVGDTSDNVPGIAGIGPKTARALLEQYGTIEGIYEHIGDVPQKEKLLAARDEARLMKRLVSIALDAPTGIATIEELAVREDEFLLRAKLGELGFSSLLKRIDAPAEAAPEPRKERPAKKTKGNPAQGAMF